jgi:hypothetical protein
VITVSLATLLLCLGATLGAIAVAIGAVVAVVRAKWFM